MKNLIARIRVLLKAAPTYLAAVGVVVALVADEVGKLAPSGWQDNAVQILGTVGGIVAAAAAIVRRVTPIVDRADHGLLAASADDKDRGDVTFQLLFLCLAIVCFVVFALIAHGTVTSDDGLTWLGVGLALFAAGHLP